MKITRIFAHRVELPLVETTYKWSGGKSVTVFDSTIVGVETDTGLIGYGVSVRSGRFICRRMRRACAPVCVSSARICSAKIRANS